MRVVLLPAFTRAVRRSPHRERLTRRLARARPLPELAPGRLAQLEAFFGFDRFVLAQLAAVTAGLDGQQAWVCAEPVCVQVDIASLRLIAFGDGLDLSVDEELSLFASFCEGCKAHGIAAQRASAGRWYIAQPEHWPSPASDPPEQWLGRILDRSWSAPTGVWGRLLAELEMIFARHPVNEGRRRRGLCPVTGVWVWGGRPEAAKRPGPTPTKGWVVTADPLVAACAHRSRLEVAPKLENARRKEVVLLDRVTDEVVDPLALPVPAQWWFACGRRFALGRFDRLCFWRRSAVSAEEEAWVWRAAATSAKGGFISAAGRVRSACIAPSREWGRIPLSASGAPCASSARAELFQEE